MTKLPEEMFAKVIDPLLATGTVCVIGVPVEVFPDSVAVIPTKPVAELILAVKTTWQLGPGQRPFFWPGSDVVPAKLAVLTSPARELKLYCGGCHGAEVGQWSYTAFSP